MTQITESESAGVHVDAPATDQRRNADEIASNEPCLAVEEVSAALAEVLPLSPPAEGDHPSASNVTPFVDIATPLPVQEQPSQTLREAESPVSNEKVLTARDETGTLGSVVATDPVATPPVPNQLLPTLLALAERVLSSQSQSPTPITTASVATGGDQDDFLRAVAADIHDKQYRLYGWCDAKTQALITTNAALFAAVGFLYAQSLNDFLAMVLLGVGAFFLGASLITCLVHVIPRISSGQSGNDPNTRSLRGIALYTTWEEYRDAFASTTKSSILTDTIRSIYGMVRNNHRSYRIIRRGVRFTLAGVVAIVAAMVTSAFAARGHHAFGSWKVETPVAAGATGSVTQPVPPPAPGAAPNSPPAPATLGTATPALPKDAGRGTRGSASDVPKKKQQ